MAKLVLTDIAAGFQSTTAANANNTLIENALENTLSRDGTSPNTMSADIDMNGNTLLNLADGIAEGSPITVRQYEAAASPSATAAAASAAAALVSQTAAAASAVSTAADVLLTHADVVVTNADVVATNADVVLADIAQAAAVAAAILAQSYTSMGFGGTLLDLGFVSDATVYFPTDLGVL